MIMFMSVQVAELKLELKLRSLPVSGTKTDLIERLKPFQDSPSTAAPTTIPPPATTTLTSIPMEINNTTPNIVLPAQQGATERMSSTPPVSPTPTDPFILQHDVGMSPAELQLDGSVLAALRRSPQPTFRVKEEKDKRLHEKERQIEDLMRKLEKEQRLVEELKMQLEVEKRCQSGPDSACVPSKLPSVPAMSPISTVLNSNAVKIEGTVLSHCAPSTIPNSILGSQALTSPQPTVVKLEDVTVSSGKPLQLQTQTQLFTQAPTQVTSSPQLLHQSQRSPQPQTKPQSQPATPSLQQFFISHSGGVSQVLGQPQTLLTTSGQPQTLLTGQTGTQILLPVSLPNTATTIQLPSSNVSLQV